MKRQAKEVSGVVRCQRCLKYGHQTYQCENEVAYRYRPSRTVMYKEKIKMKLNQDKGPKTLVKDPDYKRPYIEDKPSSDEDQKAKEHGSLQPAELEKQVLQQSALLKKSSKDADDSKNNNAVVHSQSSEQSQSSSQSSSSESDSVEEAPKKKRKI